MLHNPLSAPTEFFDKRNKKEIDKCYLERGSIHSGKKSKDEDEALASKTQSGIHELKPADADAHAVLEYLVFCDANELELKWHFPLS